MTPVKIKLQLSQLDLAEADGNQMKLSVVSSSSSLPADLQLKPEEIANLSTTALREKMLQGIYTVEAALMTQAGFEYQRLDHQRALIQRLERDIFSEESLSQLTLKEKIYLYNVQMNNMMQSMRFFQTLHTNVTTGLEAINQIENQKAKTREQSASKTPAADQNLNMVRQLIADKIREKTKSDKQQFKYY